MKAVFLDFASLGEDINADRLLAHFEQFIIHDTSSQSEVIEKCSGCAAVFTNKLAFDHQTISALPELRYIGLTATGVDKIDVEAAEQAGIAVTNITAYCTQSVAQHVFSVLLSLTHKLTEYQRDIAAGQWQRQLNFSMLHHPIRELSGLTLGIIGYGELGKEVGRLAEAFGMRVVLAQRDDNDKRPDRLALTNLFAQSDVISLHCPLTAQTHQLIDAKALEQMKENAILINTARGALVDTGALAAALREKRIGGAAIDVLPQEPPVDGDPLLDPSLENLILTPHIAWAAREARQRAVDQTAENFAAFANGQQQNRIDRLAVS